MAELLTEHNALKHLKALVVKLGSQRKVANHLGITQQYLCDILAGKRHISSAVAHKLGFERAVIFRVKEEPHAAENP